MSSIVDRKRSFIDRQFVTQVHERVERGLDMLFECMTELSDHLLKKTHLLVVLGLLEIVQVRCRVRVETVHNPRRPVEPLLQRRPISDEPFREQVLVHGTSDVTTHHEL
jgi:hypothetical protein